MVGFEAVKTVIESLFYNIKNYEGAHTDFAIDLNLLDSLPEKL